MSANSDRHVIVIEKIKECVKLLELFESGGADLADSFSITFTAQQITDLKQAYAAARTAGIQSWQSVTANGS